MDRNIKYMVSSVRELYYDDDIKTLDDLQFYIKEQYNETINKKELSKYFNNQEILNKEDLELQYKHIGL